MAGKTRPQEQVAAGHIVSTLRKQELCAVTHFLFLCKALPPKGFTTFPTSESRWEPSVQSQDLVGDIPNSNHHKAEGHARSSKSVGRIWEC